MLPYTRAVPKVNLSGLGAIILLHQGSMDENPLESIREPPFRFSVIPTRFDGSDRISPLTGILFLPEILDDVVFTDSVDLRLDLDGPA